MEENKPIQPTDDQLISKTLSQKDKKAFDELHKRYRRKILNYIGRVVSNFQRAEDLTQEVFLRVYGSLHQYKIGTNFHAWIFKIATNVAIYELKKAGRKVEVSLDKVLSEEEEGPTFLQILEGKEKSPDELLRRKELEQKVQGVIASLSPRYRSLIILCDIQGLSYKETAAILKCNSASVGSWLRRARKAFMKKIDIDSFPISFFAALFPGRRGVFGMQHMFIRNRISMYMDDEVSDRASRRISSHIEGCSKCRRQRESLERYSLVIEQLWTVETSTVYEVNFEKRFGEIYGPEAGRRGLVDRIREWADRVREGFKVYTPPLTYPMPVPVCAAAAIALLLLITYTGTQMLPGSMPIVASIENDVEIYRTKEDRIFVPKTGTRLMEGDVILAKRDSSIIIDLDENYKMKFKELSEVKLAKLLPSRRKGKHVLEVKEGRVLAKTLPGLEGSDIVVKTPVAVSNVYGTTFLVDYWSETGETEVGVLEGEVKVAALKLPEKTVIVSPYQITRVIAPDKPPTPPRTVTDIELDELMEIDRMFKGEPEPKKKFVASLILPSGSGRVKNLLTIPGIYMNYRGSREVRKLSKLIANLIKEAKQIEDRKKYIEAIKKLQKIANEYYDPEYSGDLMLYVSAIKVYLKDYKEAIKGLESIINNPELGSSASLAQCLIGLIQEEKLDDKKEAIISYRKVLQFYPKSLESEFAGKRVGDLEIMLDIEESE